MCRFLGMFLSLAQLPQNLKPLSMISSRQLSGQYPFGARVVYAHPSNLDFVSWWSVGSVTSVVSARSAHAHHHQSGVGKSSLINCVFGINNAVTRCHTGLIKTDRILL